MLRVVIHSEAVQIGSLPELVMMTSPWVGGVLSSELVLGRDTEERFLELLSRRFSGGFPSSFFFLGYLLARNPWKANRWIGGEGGGRHMHAQGRPYSLFSIVISPSPDFKTAPRPVWLQLLIRNQVVERGPYYGEIRMR
jgi:hypothetical protein